MALWEQRATFGRLEETLTTPQEAGGREARAAKTGHEARARRAAAARPRRRVPRTAWSDVSTQDSASSLRNLHSVVSFPRTLIGNLSKREINTKGRQGKARPSNATTDQ